VAYSLIFYLSFIETIALEIACWLQESHLLDVMSRKAMRVGHPHAAEEIALDIGETTHTWLERNQLKQNKPQVSIKGQE
jgi:hypothetical protein